MAMAKHRCDCYLESIFTISVGYQSPSYKNLSLEVAFKANQIWYKCLEKNTYIVEKNETSIHDTEIKAYLYSSCINEC